MGRIAVPLLRGARGVLNALLKHTPPTPFPLPTPSLEGNKKTKQKAPLIQRRFLCFVLCALCFVLCALCFSLFAFRFVLCAFRFVLRFLILKF